MHGKISKITHNSLGIFEGLNSPLKVTRYHSLIIDQETLHKDFFISAWVELKSGDKEIMGISHKSMNLHGIQFHPESIMSEQGYDLLNNFLNKEV